MSAPVLRVRFVNANLTYVSGRDSRDLIEALTGRPPLWSALGRAWCSTPSTAVDLIAAAEARGYAIEITEGDPLDAIRGPA